MRCSMNCPHCANVIPDDSKYCKQCSLPAHAIARKQRGAEYYLLVAGAILFGLYLFLHQTIGSRQTNQVVAALTHSSIVLKDETENLPATSLRAIPVNAPYD